MYAFQNRLVGIERRCAIQVQDEKKRLKIIHAAALLFSSHPFHKVLLSDVALKAGVGKGTVYTYFESKEDLYVSAFYYGFVQLITQLELRIAQCAQHPIENLKTIIQEMVKFGNQNPHLFEIMRHRCAHYPEEKIKQWEEKRDALTKIIENVIRQGVTQKIFTDSRPEFTAIFIQSAIRAVMIQEKSALSENQMAQHIQEFVLKALTTDPHLQE